jgi:hypothetical protein
MQLSMRARIYHVEPMSPSLDQIISSCNSLLSFYTNPTDPYRGRLHGGNLLKGPSDWYVPLTILPVLHITLTSNTDFYMILADGLIPLILLLFFSYSYSLPAKLTSQISTPVNSNQSLARSFICVCRSPYFFSFVYFVSTVRFKAPGEVDSFDGRAGKAIMVCIVCTEGPRLNALTYC